MRDPEECRSAMRTLAKLHRICATDELPEYPGSFYTVNQEFEKHNRELRRVKKFLREKSQDGF